MNPPFPTRRSADREAAEWHEAGAGDRIDGLAGRIGDQMQVMGRHGRRPIARKACAWPVPRRLKAGTSSDVFLGVKIPLTTASHCSRLLLDPGRIAPTAVPGCGKRAARGRLSPLSRSEEHTSELQSL